MRQIKMLHILIAAFFLCERADWLWASECAGRAKASATDLKISERINRLVLNAVVDLTTFLSIYLVIQIQVSNMTIRKYNMTSLLQDVPNRPSSPTSKHRKNRLIFIWSEEPSSLSAQLLFKGRQTRQSETIPNPFYYLFSRYALCSWSVSPEGHTICT